MGQEAAKGVSMRPLVMALAGVAVFLAACVGEQAEPDSQGVSSPAATSATPTEVATRAPSPSPLVRPEGIFLVNADGTALRQLYEGRVGAFSWSPDGRHIALMTLDDEQLRLVDVQSGDVRDLGQGGRDTPRWSPDGRSLLFAGPGSAELQPPLLVQVVDVETRQRRQLIEGGVFPEWSPDGNRIAYSGPTCERWKIRHVLNLETGESRELVPAHPEAWATLSPDWSSIAYLKAEPSPDAPDAIYHVYVADFDATNERALPGEVGARTYLVWSPDGKWIDYTVTLPPGGPKNERAYLVRSDGSAAPVQIAERGAASGWSPDSTLLVVHDSETQQVYTYDVNSGQVLPVWDGIVYSDEWSPDGSRLAFVAPAPGQARADLHVFDLATRSTTTITEAPTYAATPQWSPDGDRIAFMAIGGGLGFGYCE